MLNEQKMFTELENENPENTGDAAHKENDYTTSGSFSEYSKLPPLTRDEEFTLLRKIKNENDEDAKENLIKHSYPNVVKFARRYYGFGVPFEDLVQEGMIGVMRAIELYDISHVSGARFSTYSSSWIKKKMIDAVEATSTTIKIPQWARAELKLLQKAANKLAGEFDRTPTSVELADALGWNLEKIRQISEIVNTMNPVSFDATTFDTKYDYYDSYTPKNSGRNNSGMDINSGGSDMDVEVLDPLMMEYFKKTLRSILNDQELVVIIYKFGLFGADKKTVAELASELATSKSNISFLINAAKEKILANEKIAEFYKDMIAAS